MAIPLTLQLIARTAGFKKSMDEAQSSFRKATKKILGDADGFRKIGTNFKSAGTTISLALGAPILALGGNIVKVAAEYEQAFVGVKKTVTASEEQFAALSAGIRKMATELPFGADEIAKVAEQAGQLGLKQDEILGFTKVVLDFVTSSNVPLEDAAVKLARLGVLAGEGTEKTSNLASGIVALGNDIKGSENEIVELALNFGAMGKQIGISTEFALGFAASIVETGQKAEAGGTAMSEVFRRVSIAVAESGEELDAIAEIAGTTAAGFKKSLEKDAGEAIFKLLEGINKIPGAAGDTLVAMDEIDFTGKRLGSTVLGLAGNITQTRKNIDLVTKAYKENNASIKEAEKFYNTFISKVKILAGKFNETKIILGDTLIPIFERFIKDVLEPVAKKVAELATEFSKLSPDKQEFFVELAAALVVSGPILIGLGFLITALGTILSLVSVAFFGPVGIIAAVVALGFWLIKVTGNWKDFEDAADKTTSQLAKNIKEHGLLVTALASVVNIASGFNITFEESAKAIEVLGGNLKELSVAAIDTTKEYKGWNDAILDTGESSKKAVKEITKGLSEVQKKAKEVSDEIKLAKEIESRRLKELIISDRAFDKKIVQERFDEIRKEVDDKARALFDIQEAKRRHKKSIASIEEAKGRAILEAAQKEFKARLTLQKSYVVAVQAASDVIKNAISGNVKSSSDVWKDFFASVVDILAEMAVQAIKKAAIIGAQMAIATAGITLVIGLLASVFGGKKKNKNEIRDAVDNFLKEVKRSLKDFEEDVLTTLQRVTRNNERARVLSELLQRRVAAIVKIQDINANDPTAFKGNTFFRTFFDETTKFFSEITSLESNTANPRGRLKDILKEQILLLTANSQETLDLINSEFDLKKRNINEILNLLKSQKDFIRGITQDITNVTREFFSPQELFNAQKQDIANIRKSLIGSSGQEKLSLLADLKAALLSSFNTAKNLFAPKNAQAIKDLQAKNQALLGKQGRTPADNLAIKAIGVEIAALAAQDTQSETDLMAWQQTVITGLEKVKTAGTTAFDGLIKLQLREIQLSESSLVTEQGMKTLLSGIANASALSISLLGKIAKSPATTSAATLDELSRALSVIFPDAVNNPTLQSILATSRGLTGGIPMLASGGIVTKPMQAIIGESGPEAVIPLSKANGLGTTINITLNVKDAASLSTNKWEQILKENLGTAMERINRQGFRSSLQPKVLT